MHIVLSDGLAIALAITGYAWSRKITKPVDAANAVGWVLSVLIALVLLLHLVSR